MTEPKKPAMTEDRVKEALEGALEDSWPSGDARMIAVRALAIRRGLERRGFAVAALAATPEPLDVERAHRWPGTFACPGCGAAAGEPCYAYVEAGRTP